MRAENEEHSKTEEEVGKCRVCLENNASRVLAGVFLYMKES